MIYYILSLGGGFALDNLQMINWLSNYIFAVTAGQLELSSESTIPLSFHGSRRRISKNKYIPVMKLGSFILEKCAAQSILMFCNIMLAIKEFFKLSHFLLHMTCRKTSKSRDSDNKKQEL